MQEIVEEFLRRDCDTFGPFGLGEGLQIRVFVNRDAAKVIAAEARAENDLQYLLAVVKVHSRPEGMCYLARHAADQRIHFWGIFTQQRPFRRFDRIVDCATMPSIEQIVAWVREELSGVQ